MRSLSLISIKALLFYLLAASPFCQANGIQLPELGDASSGLVSQQQEYTLGQKWLRMYRSRVPTSTDPLLNDYLEQLLHKLAAHSQLQDRRLELLLVKNPSMNAFAVPGGIVGVHTGLFLSAESEHQLSSVLSHELAHLSQRHFARSVEQQKNASIPTMAAMLASLVLAATTGSEAGLAAITATQAASLDARLRFSRQNEQEADRIGMLTMVDADMNPHSVPKMFERMLRATRYSRRPPEFLLSHPVTESRIADALNRAAKYPVRQYESNIDYYLMRSRIQLTQEETPQTAIKRFSSEIEGDSLSPEASRYGLVLALTQADQLEEAHKVLQDLLAQRPQKEAYNIAAADIYISQKQYNKALILLKQQLSFNPNSHPLLINYADALMKAGDFQGSEAVLADYSRRRANDSYVWYLLAEVRGLAGNILGVHQARAEYFILNGIYDKAQQQLQNALKLSKNSFHATALLEERLKYVRSMQENSKL